jgi:hypothetical protein
MMGSLSLPRWLVLLLVLAVFCLLFDEVRAEVRPFSGNLEPVPFFVHWTFGDIQAPGQVDLSKLRFSTPIVRSFNGAANSSAVDIALFQLPADVCSASNPRCDEVWTTLGVGKRHRNSNNRNNDDDGTKNNNNNNHNRDGSTLLWCCTSLDYKNGRCDGPVNRLIIDQSIFQGQLRVIDIPGPLVDLQNKTVDDPILHIPFHSNTTNATPATTTAPTDGTASASGSASGKYVLVMANCNPNGRLVHVEGTYAFQSKLGYLPTDSIGVMHLFFALTAAYSALLLVWMGYASFYASHPDTSSRSTTTVTTSTDLSSTLPYEYHGIDGPTNSSRTPPTAPTAMSRILSILPQQLQHQLQHHQPIYRWIVLTILLGWLEAILRSLDYTTWNSYGTRSSSLLLSAIVVGVSKHTLSRCLLVMVSLGWGVLRHPIMGAAPAPTTSAPSMSITPTLSHRGRRLPTYYCTALVLLGVAHFTFATASQILGWIIRSKLQTFSQMTSTIATKTTELELISTAVIVDLCVQGLNVLFGIWILAAMSNTMTYLHDHGQNRNLIRYRRLRTLLLVVVALILLWNILVQVEVLYYDHTADKVSILLELIYFIMISGVAILWLPLLPTTDQESSYYDDMEVLPNCDEYELELREDIVQVPAPGWEHGNHHPNNNDDGDDGNYDHNVVAAAAATASSVESGATRGSMDGGVLS